MCVMDNPDSPKARPICIPQEVDDRGAISVDIMQQILIDTKLDLYHYFQIRAIVVGETGEKKAAP